MTLVQVIFRLNGPLGSFVKFAHSKQRFLVTLRMENPVHPTPYRSKGYLPTISLHVYPAKDEILNWQVLVGAGECIWSGAWYDSDNIKPPKSFSNQYSGLHREKNIGQSIWTSPSEEVVFAYLSIRAIQPRQKPDEGTNQGPWSRQKWSEKEDEWECYRSSGISNSLSYITILPTSWTIHDSHHQFRWNAILASLNHWNLNADYRIISCRRPPDFETWDRTILNQVPTIVSSCSIRYVCNQPFETFAIKE